MTGGVFMGYEYTKPSIVNLKGKRGRNFVEAIRNSKVPDHTQLRHEAEECKKRLLAKRKNGADT